MHIGHVVYRKLLMEWHLKTFNELTVQELYGVLQLRSEVFVVEQTCVYQDIDGTDESSYHLFCIDGSVIVAYARIIPPGINYETASIGRVVVKRTHRRTELGKTLMLKSIHAVEELFSSDKITISAQLYLKRFYNQLGFAEVGEPYPEDDIPHIKMKYGS